MKILHIDSSVSADKSVSRKLTQSTVEELTRKHPDAEVIARDLVSKPLRHCTAVLRFFGDAPDQLTEEQKQELQTGIEILDEFLAADLVVVGAPMYNFSIPSQLKAWVDLLCVPGKTFKYSSAGPEGQCGNTRIIIVSTRGGLYGEGSARAAYDFQENYLKTVFGFLGVKQFEIVRAEGVAMGPEKAAAAIAAAHQQIAQLA